MLLTIPSKAEMLQSKYRRFLQSVQHEGIIFVHFTGSGGAITKTFDRIHQTVTRNGSKLSDMDHKPLFVLYGVRPRGTTSSCV
jgi:hypothetical protein